eukprot:TRINITY_DN8878_c0_g1_i4.p3 TRINITY_DN8878_c0_g1~~TRINITY_DN8878_c0_g1_i4.p3  ORF type:complete len:114 (+),score=13.27 TRINITY_DN8878_c0_g1_i4:186-527(+)
MRSVGKFGVFSGMYANSLIGIRIAPDGFQVPEPDHVLRIVVAGEACVTSGIEREETIPPLMPVLALCLDGCEEDDRDPGRGSASKLASTCGAETFTASDAAVSLDFRSVSFRS